MSDKKKIFLLLFPIMLFVVVFTYYPFVKNIVYSLFRVTSRGEIREFTGLQNFISVYSRPDFAAALKHSLIICAVNVPATLLITVSLALIANKRRKLSRVYESMFSMSMGISMSAACMIFKAMFSPSVGFINFFFGCKYGWFQSSDTALASCLFLTIWIGIGFDFLLILSALREIPKSITEAALIDGIGGWKRFFRIQLPLISPTILYVVCTNFVHALMTSAPMIIIVGMSAESSSVSTLISMMYQSGISGNNFSLAAVISLTAFAMALMFTVLSFVSGKRRVYYQ